MAKITVNALTTYNQTPTISGTVEFERFDTAGNPKQTIQIVINYTVYKLFGGNLGLDETQTPNVWKLHFDYPLYPGIYDIEANVIDVATNTIVASDSTTNELRIENRPTYIAYPKPPELSLLQKFLLVNSLMNQMNRLFGGKNGITPLPSVHPVADDQSSTSDFARGNDERNQNAVVKNADERAKANKAPNGKPDPHPVTSSGGGDPLATLSPEAKEAAAKLALDSQGGSIGPDGTIELPAPLEELGGSENLPTTDQVMEGLGLSNTAQDKAAAAFTTPEGQPVYDAMGNFTGTYEPAPANISSAEIEQASSAYRNVEDTTYREDGGFSPTANQADVDAALARAIATTEANKIPNIVDAYLK